jgi:hypothetical protein
VVVNFSATFTIADPAGCDWSGCACGDEEDFEPEPRSRREELLAELIRVLGQHQGLFETLGDR